MWFNFFKEVLNDEKACMFLAKFFVEHRMSFEQLRCLNLDYLDRMGVKLGDCITILNHPKVKGIKYNFNWLC
jgi:hypothetical protein